MAGDADQAFARFSAFFGALIAGVQVLALLDARPIFLDLLARLLAVAPRLADKLARRPALLDALIEPRFAVPLGQDAPGLRLAELQDRLADADTFEDKLNAARRFHREEAFRIAVQISNNPHRRASGRSLRGLAESCVSAMADAAPLKPNGSTARSRPSLWSNSAIRRPRVGRDSDLDLMLVYDAPQDRDGALPAADFYTRLTHGSSARYRPD